MFYQKIDRNIFIIRIKRREQVISTLKKFFQKLKIINGFFYGLGALDEVKLGDYNVETKKYHEEEFSGQFELVNITGNVMDSVNGLVIHAHATLSKHDMTAFAGHFTEGRVSGTVEIYFSKLESKIVKKYDQETGLKLMELEKEP